MKNELQKHLASLGACPEAREWVGEKTAKEAWEQCERPDWLLWWAIYHTQRNSSDKILMAACDCARLLLDFMPDDDHLRSVLKMAEKWIEDEDFRKGRENHSAVSMWLVNIPALKLKRQTWTGEMRRKYCDAIRARLVCPWEEGEA